MEPEGSLTCSLDPTTCNCHESDQIRAPSYFFKINFNIILPPTPRCSKWFLSLKFLNLNRVCTFSLPHTCHMPLLYYFSWFYHLNNIWVSLQIVKLFVTKSAAVSCYLVGPNFFLSTLFSDTFSLCSLMSVTSFPLPTGEVIVLYILNSIFLCSKEDDKKISTEC